MSDQKNITEGGMADPARELRHRLNDVAPPPTLNDDAVTAEGVIRYLSAEVILNMSRFAAMSSAGEFGVEYGRLAQLMSAQFGTAYALRQLQSLNGEAADAHAEAIVSAWEMGETEEWAMEFLGDADSERVCVLAARITEAERAGSPS